MRNPIALGAVKKSKLIKHSTNINIGQETKQ